VVGGDFAGQGLGVRGGARACAREADVEGVDAQRFHQVKQLNFFFDGGVVNGRILQTVAESFVVEQDAGAGRDGWRGGLVPVIDEFGV